MKRIIAVLLCVILSAACAFSVSAGQEATEFRTAADVLDFVMVSKDYTVPVRIAPAVLTLNGENTAVYFIALLGMKSVKGQVNSSVGGGTDVYASLVKDILFETVPEGSSLVFAGHSLGGMTAQILRCDPNIKSAYTVVNTLCGGSPLMDTKGEGEGSLHRLTDIFDVIPYIRSLTLFSFIRQIKTAHRENGGYFFNPDGAHNKSYARNDVWGKYDVLGEKGGNASLTFNQNEITEYGAAA